MKKGLPLLTALLFVSGASMAQKAVNVDGKAIIDCRDMPANTITTERKARTTKGTNTTSGPNDLTDLGSAETNKTVYHYFEVAISNAPGQLYWLEAIQKCEKYDSGDGKQEWRLPTTREVQLIGILAESLKNKVPSFDIPARSIWSATSLRAGDAFTHSLRENEMRSYSKNVYIPGGFISARCIRDLTPPAK